MDKINRTQQVRQVGGVLSLAAGAVPLILNLPYLFSGDDRLTAGLTVAAGLLAAGIGVWLLAGARSRGAEQVLTADRGRVKFMAATAVLCAVLLIISLLLLQQPTTSTGLFGLLLANSFRMLFVPVGRQTR
ncbi:hypothetical protein NNX39_06850 [Arthrobacter sp. zg-Y826]|uniref:hypothetical protein n=1 Tax=Arthrobacter jinronghuae TaxID=2964609 RepID=UPI0021049F0C|nr:hypothetical protein [Arthrobacter jinronghuae]MCQ1956224.1 hypothetical protein [Arthrobacter jinronghuae]